MTPTEINIAIAEACGWKPRNYCNGYYRDDAEGWIESLPDYYNDINAMHEAENGLDEEQRDELMRKVYVLLDVEGTDTGDTYPDYKLYHATAPQRAEAFLRTIGKWRDE